MNDTAASHVEEPLPYLVCDGALNVERLVVEAEGDRDEVFVLSCPRGDFERAATRAQLLRMMTAVL